MPPDRSPGADEVADGTRTRDHRDHNPGLYQLSYRHRARVRIPAPLPAARGGAILVLNQHKRCRRPHWEGSELVVSPGSPVVIRRRKPSRPRTQGSRNTREVWGRPRTTACEAFAAARSVAGLPGATTRLARDGGCAAHGVRLVARGGRACRAAPPLAGDTTADVVVVGGGYLGLWTAWQLRQLEPACDVVVLEAGSAVMGRAGERRLRLTLWDDLPACATASATSARSTSAARRRRGAGDRRVVRARRVDAWFRAAPTLYVATSAAQLGAWADASTPAAHWRAGGGRADRAEEVRARCASPAFRGGALRGRRPPSSPRGSRSGCEGGCSSPGVRIYERTHVGGLRRRRSPSRARRRVRAGAAVLAVNAATAGLPGFRARARRRVEPHRPDRARARRARGARLDGRRGDRRLPHAPPLLPHDARRPDRLRLGRRPDGLRRRAALGGSTSTRTRRTAARRPARASSRSSRGRRVTHAWGGPIDVSPTHLPIFGSRGRIHHGFGFTGNGVGPSYLGGEILARLALDRRDELTRLALVDPDRKLMPPEPLR